MFVKICGITRLQDALCAVENGADAIGFIFAESKRKVSISTVSQIVEQ
ncbi:MAG: N-(5'-phosphoribosyl)anthranilate isomerase, partial [Actinobacteria bacterium]